MQTEEKLIWGTIHKTFERGESDDVFISDVNFIENLPIEIKTIIVFYSKKVYMISSKENIKFANALGNFSSLEEAQQILLTDKDHYFKNVKTDYPYISYLKIEMKEDKVFVIISGSETDEYIIQKDGNIKFAGNKKIKK
jgi:hypothetical protein